MVEGARLESVYAGNRIKGSNPFLSASLFQYNIDNKWYFLENWMYAPHFNPQSVFEGLVRCGPCRADSKVN